MALLNLLCGVLASSVIVAAQQSVPGSTFTTEIVAASSEADADGTTPVQTLRLPHVTGVPYTPYELYISTLADGECMAVLSLQATNPTQAAIDCSAIASPTKYPSTTTRHVDVFCGGCEILEVEGAAHGCPLLPADPTPVATATAPLTAIEYRCAGQGAR